MTRIPMKQLTAIGLSVLLLSTLSVLGAAAPARERGNLTARVMDEEGQPLAGVLVSFLQRSTTEKLPILIRSNEAGLISLKNLAAGSYDILVRSSRFRTSRGSDAEVTPGRTEFVNVVLQQILGLEVSEEENLSAEALLRILAADRNGVILRTQQGGLGDAEGIWSDGRAVLSISTNPGLGGDCLVFPSDSAGGSVTNFAVENPLGFGGTSVLAGQLSSGEDSLWRLKNFANLSLSDRHDLQIFLGYGRLSFNQPRLGLVDAPLQLGGTAELSQVSGPLSSLTLGVSDRWQWGDSISFQWGMEVNRIRSSGNQTFASPNAQFSYSPFKGTELRVLSASKRTTQGNNLELPSGDSINISDAVYISRVGDEIRLGTARYNQASLRQELGSQGRVEVAAFSNEVRGAGHPFALEALGQPGVEVFQLQDRQGNTSGYRITYERQLDENLKAAVTYIYGSASGLEAASELSLEQREGLPDLLQRGNYHLLAAQVDAYLPFSKTNLTALVKLMPQGGALSTLDSYSDYYQTSNEGVNLFVRQMLPLPVGLFKFLGLDFLTPQNIEALLDIRNLTNEQAGVLHTFSGDVVLLQNPRTVRGGITLKF